MLGTIPINCSQQLAQVVVLRVWALFCAHSQGVFLQDELSFWKICSCHRGRHSLRVALSLCVNRGHSVSWRHFPHFPLDLSLKPSDKIITANASNDSKPLQLILSTVLLLFVVGSEWHSCVFSPWVWLGRDRNLPGNWIGGDVSAPGWKNQSLELSISCYSLWTNWSAATGHLWAAACLCYHVTAPSTGTVDVRHQRWNPYSPCTIQPGADGFLWVEGSGHKASVAVKIPIISLLWCCLYSLSLYPFPSSCFSLFPLHSPSPACPIATYSPKFLLCLHFLLVDQFSLSWPICAADWPWQPMSLSLLCWIKN